MLRPYQQRAIDMLYAWFAAHDRGNPCLVLPTGSGKSHIIAALCKDALQNWPETRVLMLTHVKELISQNAQKLRQHWPGAPMGIYSASLNRRTLGEPITFAGIQSVRKRASQIGHIDLVIVDECFVAGTQILTPDGSVDIDALKCGDVVLNQCGTGRVEATSCKFVNDTYIVELSNGSSLECTGNHPFFTPSGWKAARELEVGTCLFSPKDMSALWQRVSSLDQNHQRKDDRNAGNFMEQAEILLHTVCQEIKPDCAQCSGEEQNKCQAQRDKTSAYQAWRKRAITAFATPCVASCVGGWVGSGVRNQDARWTPERGAPQLLQSRYCERNTKNSHRVGRQESLPVRSEGTGFEKNESTHRIRVVRVSRVERKSPIAVFNIRVSGHPSYFAEGIAVHNCHLISHEAEGGYRTLLAELERINPALRVIGLTATPYRLGHGLITDEPAIFSDLIEPVSIEELIHLGFLAPLKSKVTTATLDVSGVHKRGGEFIESELQKAVDTDANNQGIVAEVIERAGDRRAWLFFCTGVAHAEHVAGELTCHGITAACVTGKTPRAERDQILNDFKAGKIKALTNANVLTTGFDYPDIDLIAMLRPTCSPGLYVQMAGRGLRPKSHIDHCLVLDFAGVVRTHGPITNVATPVKAGNGDGTVPAKVCPECGELIHASRMVCDCGYEFPEQPKPPLELHDDDIMGLEYPEMVVAEWVWERHVSRNSGKEMLRVTYYGDALSDPVVTEYFPVTHEGYAANKAMRELKTIAQSAGSFQPLPYEYEDLIDEMLKIMQAGKAPELIKYRKDGKFYRVISRSFLPQGISENAEARSPADHERLAQDRQ